ncbi:hypothetical protein [Niveibacterium terrae]|uniref:hypothetical protein n=1 Tax=Niveibacterium terrae TaxID=3373598 RepID=UPI003A911167
MIRCAPSPARKEQIWRACGLIGLILALWWLVFVVQQWSPLLMGRPTVLLFGAAQMLTTAAFAIELVRRGQSVRGLHIASLICAAFALIASKTPPVVAMAVYASLLWLALRLGKGRH